MPRVLHCYYLDAPLSSAELAFAERALLGHFAKFKTGAAEIIQKRVPFLVPAPPLAGHYTESREDRAVALCGNLRHAGISADTSRRVLWVIPRESEWDALFQFAIQLETGFAPYALQREPLKVFDLQMLLDGLK